MMRHALVPSLVLALTAASACVPAPAVPDGGGGPSSGSDGGVTPVADAGPAPDGDVLGPPWQLVWRDEFDGPAGTPPDPTRWKHDVGGHGWGNDQLEYDTDRPENASLDGQGHLAIVARKESYGGRSYTSARLNTAGRFARAYGRFEARLRQPIGQGLWPAFWLLGNDIGAVGWPGCGEIDVME
jgi:beta-glucanase (GH16 family)